MRLLLISSIFFSLPVFAENVQMQVGFNLFKCVIQDGEASCVSPSIEFETIDISLANGRGNFETTYTRDKLVFEYSLKISQYFNTSTKKKNYLLYLDLFSYVEGDKDNGVRSSASISTVDFESLNQIEIDGSLITVDNIRALPFFGIAPLNKVISAKDKTYKNLKYQRRINKIAIVSN